MFGINHLRDFSHMLRTRYRRIIIFFGRILASIIFWDLLLPSIGLKKWSRNTRSERYRNIAKRYRSLAIEMGGVLIKSWTIPFRTS